VTPGTASVGLATLSIPGVSPFRTLQVPTSGTPDQLIFHTELGGRPSCLTVAGRAACDPAFPAGGESDGVLDRTFSLSSGQRYQLAATVVPSPGPALDRLLDAGRAVTATASSVDDPDPRERPGAAVDGDLTTSWVAEAGDQTPSLTVNLDRRRTISTMRLRTDSRSPSARPERVVLRVGGRQWSLPVPADGLIRLPKPTAAKSLRITVTRAELRLTTSTLYRGPRFLPVGISEVAINGRTQSRATGGVRLDCASGLHALIDGAAVGLQASASRSQVLTGAPVTATSCGAAPVALAPGTHRIQLERSAVTAASALVLSRQGLIEQASSSPGIVTPLIWHATRRTVQVTTTAPSLLVIRENSNAGWQATLDGTRLKAVQLDGWQQGFVLPAGANGIVRLHYAPQAGFEAGLALGLLAALVLCWLAFSRARPDLEPAVAERGVSPTVLPGSALLAAFVLTGLIGLTAVGAVLALRAFTRTSRSRVPAWWAGIGICLAGAAEAWHPASNPHPLAGSVWAQTLCVLGICSAILGLGRPRQDEVEYRRSNGRSKRYQDAVPSAVAEPVVIRKSAPKWPWKAGMFNSR
jgi:arabinofuranan 3-O-arabinosyltransferase